MDGARQAWRKGSDEKKGSSRETEALVRLIPGREERYVVHVMAEWLEQRAASRCNRRAKLGSDKCGVPQRMLG